MVGARRSDAVMGLHAVENVAATSSRSRTGKGGIMPSPSAPAPNQRSSASAAGGGVHGEFGVRRRRAPPRRKGGARCEGCLTQASRSVRLDDREKFAE